ncbi:MAG TPA: hypothetical protein ENN22_12180 [bacterium]|nr:hypothetical protein [bacterium]
MSKAIKYLDYFFVMRPTLFFPVWTVFLANYHANLHFIEMGAGAGKNNSLGSDGIVSLVLLSLMMGAVFVFNQIVDRESDAKNQKLFFIARGIIPQHVAMVQAGLLTIFPVAGAFFLDIELGAIFIVTFFFTGIIYSFPAFSWKDKPILGIIANFFGGWSVAACGWIAAGAENWDFAIHALPYAIGLVAVYFLTTIPDIPGDREFGKITFGVKYGKRLTTYWAAAFEFVAVVISFVLKDFVIFFPALAALPLFVIAVVRQRLEDVLRAIKFTVLFASLAVCVVYPLYFFVLVINYFFSKWYYRKRFDLEYPKFAA